MGKKILKIKKKKKKEKVQLHQIDFRDIKRRRVVMRRWQEFGMELRGGRRRRKRGRREGGCDMVGWKEGWEKWWEKTKT